MSNPAPGDQYTVQSVDRAIAVLKAFTVKDRELTLGEIADRVGLSKSTAFRLLATLRRHELVVQDKSSGRYGLGFGLLNLAQLRLQQTDLREVASPHLRRLRDRIDETVVLCIRVGDYRVHIDQFESFQPVRRVSHIGEHVPLYAGAAGKVLLTALGDEAFEAYLGRTEFQQLASNTITDPGRLREEITRARNQGFATGLSERAESGAGIAVPVRGGDGEIVAALQVPLPQPRYNEESCGRILEELRATATTISSLIGHSGS